uniref:Homeobox protein 9 n=1 Tax=Ciona intestinalis TaxID=7719 RepID=F6ZK68_CIOIN|nr:homeobox protein 9 isoform X2 [Ciona intestinalis]|eukprot:XP_002131196.1 homeobox protein 9 isoform X2 [Ciona intestinalis]
MLLSAILVSLLLSFQTTSAQQPTTASNLLDCALMVKSCQSLCKTTSQNKYVEWVYHATSGVLSSCNQLTIGAKQQSVTPKVVSGQSDYPLVITFKVYCCSQTNRTDNNNNNNNNNDNNNNNAVQCQTGSATADGNIVANNNKLNMILYVGFATLACCLVACWMIVAAIFLQGRRTSNTKNKLGHERLLLRDSDKTTSSTYATTSESSNENRAAELPTVRLHSGNLPYKNAVGNTTQQNRQLETQLEKHDIQNHDVGCGFTVPVVTSTSENESSKSGLSRAQTMKSAAGRVEPPSEGIRNRSATTAGPKIQPNSRGDQVDLLEKYVFETILTKNARGTKDLHTTASTPNLSRIVNNNAMTLGQPVANEYI